MLALPVELPSDMKNVFVVLGIGVCVGCVLKFEIVYAVVPHLIHAFEGRTLGLLALSPQLTRQIIISDIIWITTFESWHSRK